MDYSDIRHVKRRIFASAGLIVAVFLLGNTISFLFWQIHALFRWITIIAIGILCCNIWASIVAYNASANYASRIRNLEDDIDRLRKKVK
jgi:hypothetical protein